MNTDRAMFFAASPSGLAGECQRTWPAEYIASHCVENSGLVPMDPARARTVAQLLADGWIVGRETTINVPTDTDRYSMFFGTAAHTLRTVTYHATDKGRLAWAKKST